MLSALVLYIQLFLYCFRNCCSIFTTSLRSFVSMFIMSLCAYSEVVRLTYCTATVATQLRENVCRLCCYCVCSKSKVACNKSEVSAVQHLLWHSSELHACFSSVITKVHLSFLSFA